MLQSEIPGQHEASQGSHRWLARVLALPFLLSIGLVPISTAGRDDIPTEIARRPNPVTLDESELRYYRRQFKGKCARCHGQDGKGGEAPAEAHIARAANFTDSEYMGTRSDGQLFYQILMGGGERCAMPAFGPESDHAWSEEKVWHLVAYVRRFAGDESP